MPFHPWTLVTTAAQRDEARRALEGASLVGVDTEYDSFRYFKEKLCLIQVSTDTMAFLFDPLENIDFSFLGTVFGNPGILKVLHACDNDIRLLHRDYGFAFDTIFDTHRAAAMLGSTALSLPAVIREYIGADIHKERSVQRSRWDRRPLGERQLHYAARDAGFLIPLYREMIVRLREQGLERSARELFSRMALVRWREKQLSAQGHKSIEGFDELNEAGRDRLKALYRWRFERARATNRARFMILPDRTLASLAACEAPSIEELAASGLLSPHQLSELGDEIVAILAASSAEEEHSS